MSASVFQWTSRRGALVDSEHHVLYDWMPIFFQLGLLSFLPRFFFFKSQISLAVVLYSRLMTGLNLR